MNSTSSSAGQGGHPTLARTMGLWALVIYGVGDMLGSGIYALVGKVAGVMGSAVWLAFLASLVAAGLTALSYASLGSRYPRAAGAAYVTQRAFSQPFLSYLVGLAAMASGLTSFAVQSRAFAGYFHGLAFGPAVPVPRSVEISIILSFIAVLTLVNFWGIRESTWLNLLCTFIEVSGLFIVIAVGMRFIGSVSYLEAPPRPDGAPGAFSPGLVLSSAVLAFYSFIGFEDMINVSEEVKNPRRNFPIAVILAVAITAAIYILVSLAAVSALPHAQLAASKQPLVDVVGRAAPGFPSWVFSIIAMFAITNTALLNYIMGSRLVYGMARQGFLPRLLGTIHAWRRTPHVAIAVLMLIVIVLALSGGIAELASATSALLLFVFIIINASLIALKNRAGEPEGSFEAPIFVPLAGMIVCAAMLTQADARAMKLAFLLLVGITLVYLITRPANISEDTLAGIE